MNQSISRFEANICLSYYSITVVVTVLAAVVCVPFDSIRRIVCAPTLDQSINGCFAFWPWIQSILYNDFPFGYTKNAARPSMCTFLECFFLGRKSCWVAEHRRKSAEAVMQRPMNRVRVTARTMEIRHRLVDVICQTIRTIFIIYVVEQYVRLIRNKMHGPRFAQHCTAHSATFDGDVGTWILL